MSDLQLVIGEKNRSPWSLRAWLLLKQLGLAFEEVTVPLGRADTHERILQHSPSGKLPVLVAGRIRVWEPLAIAEFLADHFPALWPDGIEAKALARSISAEVQSGFRELETFLPMDFTTQFGPPGRLLTPVAANVRRVTDIWSRCRTGFGEGGPFLFGAFSIADAMFAPICAAFSTHAITLDDTARAYAGQMLGLPAMQEWAETARGEQVGAAAAKRSVTATGAALPPLATPTPPLPAAAPAEPNPPPSPAPAAAAPPAAAPPPPRPAPPPARAPAPQPEDDDEELGPPAPGLPGVVPTRAYADEEEPARDGAGRRLVRPPVTSGLFRWRQPRPAEPEPVQAAPAPPAPPPPDVPPPATALPPWMASPPPAERPAEPLATVRPTPPAAPATIRPAAAAAERPPEPPVTARPMPPVAPVPVRPIMPMRPEASPAAQPVATLEQAAPEPAPAMPTRPGSLRGDTIKPIGDGIRRRR